MSSCMTGVIFSAFPAINSEIDHRRFSLETLANPPIEDRQAIGRRCRFAPKRIIFHGWKPAHARDACRHRRGNIVLRLLQIVGEPQVDRAIAFETAMDEAKAKPRRTAAKGIRSTKTRTGTCQPSGSSWSWPFHRRHRLQCGLRRPVRACLRSWPIAAWANSVRARRRLCWPRLASSHLCRPKPQISGQSAVGWRSGHDRHAHGTLFRDDPDFARRDDCRGDAAAPPQCPIWRLERRI